MKIFKSKYKLKNTTGGYDTVHFETSAEQVVTNNLFQFVTEEEKANWNNKADTYHTHPNYSENNHNHDSVYSQLGHTHNVEDFVGLDFNASSVSIEDTATLLEATNVEEALAEIVKKANTNASSINGLNSSVSGLQSDVRGLQSSVSSLENELGTSKSTLEANINAIREVL